MYVLYKYVVHFADVLCRFVRQLMLNVDELCIFVDGGLYIAVAYILITCGWRYWKMQKKVAQLKLAQSILRTRKIPYPENSTNKFPQKEKCAIIKLRRQNIMRG